jgi:hypothetical protein
LQTAKTEPEWTDPSATDPFPQEGRASPGIQIGPMIWDIVDMDVDLCITQLLEEAAVGTSWPQIQLHLSHPLPE